jgi:hypothetical protein
MSGLKPFFTAAAISVALTCGAGLIAPASLGQESSYSGQIFVLGEELLPPWEFSGIGEDTLRLNGIPYVPTRLNHHPDSLTVSEESQKKWELDQLVVQVTKGMASPEARIDTIMATYEASPLVDSVEFRGTFRQMGEFAVWWRGWPQAAQVKIALVDTEPSDADTRRRQIKSQQETVERFRLEMKMGYLMILIRSGHWIGCTGADKEPTLEVIRSVRSGLEVSDSLISASCFRDRSTVDEFQKYMNPVGED